jgi:hypothetical protein
MKDIPSIFILAGFIFVLTVGACKEKCTDITNPDCENYNPCYGRTTKPNADFAAHQWGSPGYRCYGDTLFADGTLGWTAVFRAADTTQKGTTYKWKVGNDPRVFTDKTIFLPFGQEVIHTTIPVQLIVSRPSDAACLKTVSDTITKSFYFVGLAETKVWGKYRGYLKSKPNEIFEINWYTNPADEQHYLDNPTNKGCRIQLSNIFAFGYKEMFVEDSRPYGGTTYSWDCTTMLEAGYRYTWLKDLHFKVNPTNDSIKIDFTQVFYSTDIDWNNLKKHEFIGVRIP